MHALRHHKCSIIPTNHRICITQPDTETKTDEVFRKYLYKTKWKGKGKKKEES